MKNNRENLISLSENEMLDIWKTQLFINPARRDCSIENEDGTDIDKFLLQQIRIWYANILKTAHPSQLPQKDFCNMISMSTSPNLVCRFRIPDDAIQPVKIRLSSWARPISKFHSPDSFMASLQYDEFTCGRQNRPVGIVLNDEMLLFSAKSQVEILSQAVFTFRPPKDTYILAESLLSTIPTNMDIL